MTQQNLFDCGESLSPKEAWMRRHKISVEYDGFEFVARLNDCARYVRGYSTDGEDDALINLANKLGLQGWNEEAYK